MSAVICVTINGVEIRGSVTDIRLLLGMVEPVTVNAPTAVPVATTKSTDPPAKLNIVTLERSIFISITPDMLPADKQEVWAWVEEKAHCHGNHGHFKDTSTSNGMTNPADELFNWEDALPELTDVIREYVEGQATDIGTSVVDHYLAEVKGSVA